MEDIVKNIVKNEDDRDDLFHCVLEQILKGKKFDGLPDDQRVFYFVRVLKNNYFSKTSPYYYQYKKNPAKEDIKEMTFFEGRLDEEYKNELPDMSWVYEQLTHLNWFDRDLFNFLSSARSSAFFFCSIQSSRLSTTSDAKTALIVFSFI